MPIIRHRDKALIQHSYRRIVTREDGATSCTVWDQTLPPTGRIPLHAHDTEEILTILAGQVLVTIDDQTTVVKSDTTIVIAPGVFHTLRNDGDTAARILVFLPTILPTILTPDGVSRPME